MASFKDSSELLNAKTRRASTISGRSTLSRRGSKMLVPEQIEDVFNGILNGLSGFEEQAQQELNDLKNGTEVFVDVDRNHNLNVQEIKQAEMHKKRVEMTRNKVLKLLERYRAIVGGTEVKAIDTLSKKQFKDVVSMLSQVETELESLLGSFTVSVKEIAGFARLCPGDQYELAVKYGGQRWRTRCRVGPDKSQSWDSDLTRFKCLIGDPLWLKVTETKFFTSPTLCEKQFITSGFFAAQPQMMSLQLNRNGSLKLILAVSWNPFNTPQPRSMSMPWTSFSNTAPSAPRREPRRPMSAFYEQMTSDPMMLDIINRSPTVSSPASSSSVSRSSSQHSSSAGSRDASTSIDLSSGNLPRQYVDISVFSESKRRLKSLMSSLKHMAYQETGELCRTAARVYDEIKRLEEDWRRVKPSEIREQDVSTRQRPATCKGSPAGNRRTLPGPSDPVWKQLSLCLCHHLQHCNQVMNSLLNSPERLNIADALYKVEVESANLNNIALLANHANHAMCVMQAFGTRTDLVKLWLRACSSQPPLIAEFDSVKDAFVSLYSVLATENRDKVFGRAMDLLSDEGRFGTKYISIYQLGSYFYEKDLATFIESLSHEVWIVTELQSDPRRAVAVIRKLQQVPVPPPPECLRHMAQVLRSRDVEAASTTHRYFSSAQGSLRENLVTIFLSFLESVDDKTRMSACDALAVMKAKRSIGLLAAIYGHDRSTEVGRAAYSALLSFGNEGKEVIRRVDMTTDVERL